MTDKRSDKVYWLANSKTDVAYDTTTWYRSVGIQEFVERVEKDCKIVGVIFSGNDIGFVLDEQTN